MKKLDSKVNIIPIIAKADTISKVELQKFKIKVCSNYIFSTYLFKINSPCENWLNLKSIEIFLKQMYIKTNILRLKLAEFVENYLCTVSKYLSMY